jgi:hypothetical protein
MRYAPSDRFWRNLLLTCVFTVFTLGFSVASYHGLKVSSPVRAPIEQGTVTPASATASGMADLVTARPNYARASDVPLEELGAGGLVGAPVSFSAATGGDAAASGTGAVGGTRDLSRRGQSASSSSRGSGGGSSKGFAGASFSGKSSRKDLVGEKKTSSPSVSRKSNGKGHAKKGGNSEKGKTAETAAPRESRALGSLYADKPSAAASPASTPEPLSMLLMGTGLAGLYRARKYLK